MGEGADLNQVEDHEPSQRDAQKKIGQAGQNKLPGDSVGPLKRTRIGKGKLVFIVGHGKGRKVTPLNRHEVEKIFHSTSSSINSTALANSGLLIKLLAPMVFAFSRLQRPLIEVNNIS